MKTKFFFLRTITAIVLIGSVITSCKKETTTEDTDTQSASDNSLAESNFNDVQSISEQANDLGSLLSYKMQNPYQELTILSACATVTKDTVANPHTITIDFGATNCTCTDGKMRRGQILVSYTGPYRATGTVITHTFNNYFVNDNQVTGTKTVTNNGPNGAGNLIFAINASGNVILANNGGTISWTSTRTREWTAGSATQTVQDDVYSITGGASGTSAAGNTFVSQITTPLVRKMATGCRQIVSGVIVLSPANKAIRTIDYGTGVCDDQATVTINGHSRTITLR